MRWMHSQPFDLRHALDCKMEVLFQLNTMNADIPFYLSSNLESLLDEARKRKKIKYRSAAEQRKATFTPVIDTCEAIFDHEEEVYLKKISAFEDASMHPQVCQFMNSRFSN